MKLKTLIIALSISAVMVLTAVGIVAGSFVWKQVRARQAYDYLVRGYADARRGESDSAILNFSKCIQLSPTNGSAYYGRAAINYRQKDYDEAIKDFTRAIHLQPTNWWAFEFRGLSYANRNEYDKAIADFTEVIERDVDIEANYYRRGFTYGRASRWKDAIDDYRKVIRLDPTNASCFHSLGYAYSQELDPTNADRSFKKALALVPDNIIFLNSLAWFLAVCPDASFRDGESAVSFAEKACRLTDWRKRFCVDTLAAAYAEKGDYTNAVKFEKQALRMDSVSDKDDLVEQNRLKLYQENKPYREIPKAMNASAP